MGLVGLLFPHVKRRRISSTPLAVFGLIWKEWNKSAFFRGETPIFVINETWLKDFWSSEKLRLNLNVLINITGDLSCN